MDPNDRVNIASPYFMSSLNQLLMQNGQQVEGGNQLPNFPESQILVPMETLPKYVNLVDCSGELKIKSNSPRKRTPTKSVIKDEFLTPSPRKRGRPKQESCNSCDELSTPPSTPSPRKSPNVKLQGDVEKVRRKIDRFGGIPEEEVAKKFLPDHLTQSLDIVIVGINPGLFAAYKGHHYAGPGNHFWKCLYMSGLIPEPFTAYDDFRLLDYGIGFTNIVARTTRGSADLTKKEIKEGAETLLEKLQEFRPRIAVFNGKGIYEIFCGRKDFLFGRQPEKINGTETHIWVMPSSSARCAQLPRALDKVPFYVALRKFRDYLKGDLEELDDSEIVFHNIKLTNFKNDPDGMETKPLLTLEDLPLWSQMNQVKDEVKEQVNADGLDQVVRQFSQVANAVIKQEL